MTIQLILVVDLIWPLLTTKHINLTYKHGLMLVCLQANYEGRKQKIKKVVFNLVLILTQYCLIV